VKEKWRITRKERNKATSGFGAITTSSNPWDTTFVSSHSNNTIGRALPGLSRETIKARKRINATG